MLAGVDVPTVFVKRPCGHYRVAVHAKRHVVAVSFVLGFLARVAKFVRLRAVEVA